MDIERERGITIKSQAVRMPWTVAEGNEQGGARHLRAQHDRHPGHVDFTYEVSRSLEACEAAVLLVDAAQGSRPRRSPTSTWRWGADLHIIPSSTRSTCPGRTLTSTQPRSPGSWGATRTKVLRVSAGRLRCRWPARRDRQADATSGRGRRPAGPAPIFDSVYDTYRSVITYVRVVDGSSPHRDRIKMMSTGATHERYACSARPS